MDKKEETKALDLTNIISKAIQIPGVKVSRDSFLREQFKNHDASFIEQIIQKGPVEAGCNRTTLYQKACRLIKERTAFSTSASFFAGLPGGILMAATIPADLLQFYAVALRMAQELVYLYGEKDMWCEGASDPDKVTNQLILYCGVMLGATGASQAVKVMSSALSKQALKKIPRMALMKTFYYPIIKSTLKFFGVSVTKSSFAKGISKSLPIVGGVISGSITLASMYPMGKRLIYVLDEAHFAYSYADFQADIDTISSIQNQDDTYTGKTISAIVHETQAENNAYNQNTTSTNATYEKIQKAKQLLDCGALTEQEFAEIKARLIGQL